MNRSIDKRLNALEARLLSPAVDTKLSIDGFDMDKYQRLLHELTTQDGWFDNWRMALGEWAREHEGKKVPVYGNGWFQGGAQ